MATKKTTDAAESSGKKYDNSVRRWTTPSKRADSFAKERKAKVHQHGDKEGQQLTDYESGIRSGYLLCQSDHAGQYIYSKALSEGKSKEEAKKLSRTKGKFRKNKEAK